MILGALAATVAALSLAPGTSASPSQESMVMDDIRLVYGTDAQVEQALDLLRSIGVDRLRVSVFWRLLAPNPDDMTRPSFDATNPSDYSASGWKRYDRIVVGARRRGIAVLFTITGPAPLWASSDPSRGDRRWEPQASDFQRFATAVGRRYSGDWPDEGPLRPRPPEAGSRCSGRRRRPIRRRRSCRAWTSGRPGTSRTSPAG